MDYFLKFANEAEALAALAPFCDGGGLLTSSADHAIDVVGTIHKPTGETALDDTGIPYAIMAPIAGWHVNLRVVGGDRMGDAEALNDTYGVTPAAPNRVFL